MTFLLFLFFSLSLLLHPACPSLIFVIETYRHGAREPIRDYWNAKEFKSKGELTPVGMRQHYILGQLLRSEYIDSLGFLSQSYDSTELYVYSTNVNRTIMSAQSQLYGMYPLGSGPKVPDNVNFSLMIPPFNDSTVQLTVDDSSALPNQHQPIPVHTNRIDQEYLLRSWDPNVCKVNKKWYQEQYNTTAYKELLSEFNETLMKVADMVNVNKATMDFWKLHDIYDVFQNDIYAGKAVPNDFEVYHKNMSFLYDTLVYMIDFGSVKQKRVLSTPFFQKVISLFEGKISGTDARKWIMYSAHDITLIMILAGLNYTSFECQLQARKTGVRDRLCMHFPTYASNLLIELHNNSNAFTVKVRYNGEYLMEYNYEDFINKLQGSLVDDFLPICRDEVRFNAVDETKNEQGGSMGGWGWFFLGLVIGLGLSLVGAVILYKKYLQKRGEQQPFVAELEVIQNR